MQLLPWTTRSLAFVGDDLFIVDLAGGPLGIRESRVALIPGFGSMHAAEARAAVARHRPPRSARLLVVVPGDVVSVRRMAIGTRSWARASQEVRGSIEKLLPLDGEHAVIGLVDRADDAMANGEERRYAADSTPSVGQGYLLGIDGLALAAMLDPIRLAFGRGPDLVIAPQQALLGLGLQREASTIVLDESPPGVPVHHELRRGALVRLSEPGHPAVRDAARLASASVLLMPGANAPDLVIQRSRRLDGYDLATAAALAEHVAPGAFAPLRGQQRSRWHRWLASGLAAALGIVLLFLSGRMHSARVDAELVRIRAAAGQIAPALAEAEARQARLTALTGMLARLESAWSEEDPSVIEAYRALRDAVPVEGFVYRVSIDKHRISLSAEAPRAGVVLERVENSPMFQRASMRTPTTVPERPTMEQFEVTAERVPRPSVGAASGGEGRAR